MSKLPPKKRVNPILFHLSIALTLAAFAVLGLWYLLGAGHWLWYQWVGAWLLAINILTFAYYGLDKAQAQRSSRRIPEVVLHILTSVGGTLGAYAGMRLFHHKTIKGTFRIIFWMIVVCQAALLVLIVRELWLAQPPPA